MRVAAAGRPRIVPRPAPRLGRSHRRDRGPARVECRNRVLFREREVIRVSDDSDELSAILPPSDARATHVREVLKLGSGDALRVGVVNGAPATAVVASSDVNDGLVLRWRPGVEAGDEDTTRRRLADGSEEGDDDVRIDLLLAMPRPKVLSRLWAPLASVGVSTVFVTNAARVERCYFDSKALEREAVEREMLRGLEQSGGCVMPGVCVVKRFPAATEAVLCPHPSRGGVDEVADEVAGGRATGGVAGGGGTDGPAGARRNGVPREGSATWLVHPPPARGDPGDPDDPPPVMLMAHPGGRASLRDAMGGVEGAAGGTRPRRVVIAVGPEGGWTEYEQRAMKSAGFVEVALGNRTFATDVACIALVAAVRERTQSW